MQRSHVSLARSRAYALFGELYRTGVTPAVLPVVRAVAELAEALPDAFDADQAAADHYEVFHLNVFPYASLFLDDAGRVGGAVTDAARRWLRQVGYAADTSREGADHVGHALRVLAFLSGAETDAWRDERADEARRVQTLQRRFFDAYLLWWLPAFAQAVRRHGHPFYSALGDLTLDLALDHRATLGPAAAAEPEAFVLPDPPALLDEARSGLKDIADYLTTPVWSGFYLSRTDIGRLGRTEELPRGFGARALMLANLLRAAVDYDRLDPLLTHLQDLTAAWQSYYHILADRAVPGLDAITPPWLRCLATTRRLLDRIREAYVGNVE